jgi:hypothetical protein
MPEPICRDCRHFFLDTFFRLSSPALIESFAHCTHPNHQGRTSLVAGLLVAGEAHSAPCWFTRRLGGCGNEGKWFEAEVKLPNTD